MIFEDNWLLIYRKGALKTTNDNKNDVRGIAPIAALERL